MTMCGSSPQAWGTGFEMPGVDNDRDSSPQAWGTVNVEFRGTLRDRFIPTGVGNGRPHSSQSFTIPVHPHRRGERLKLMQKPGLNFGSSPQAWGTVP